MNRWQDRCRIRAVCFAPALQRWQPQDDAAALAPIKSVSPSPFDRHRAKPIAACVCMVWRSTISGDCTASGAG